MNIPFLILAQVITAYTYPPDIDGGRMTDIRVKTMPDPLINYSRRLDEHHKIGRAVKTGQVYDPFSGQTMIKTQAPPSPYHNMSYEEASQRRAMESQNLQREASLRESELKQKSESLEYKYRLNQIGQSEKFLDEMSSLDPRSPDYMAQRSQLSSTYPLAAQNPLILKNIDLLDRTYNDLEQNKALLGRHAVEQGAREAAALRKQEISQGRTIISKYGDPSLLATFEEEVAKDGAASPIAVAAKLEDASQRLSMLERLQELEVDNRKFYLPDGNGRLVFNKDRAQQILASYPTAPQAHQAANSREKIRQNNAGEYKDWAPDVQADYDLFGDQVQRYRSSIGQKQEKAAPTVKSVDDFF